MTLDALLNIQQTPVFSSC